MKKHIPFPMNPKTREEIASEYHTSPKTFARKLKLAGIKLKPGLIMPIDQIKIYKAFGPPADPDA